MAKEKKLYRVEAFEWVFGERITRKERYVHAHSTQQAIFLAFRHTCLNEGWSVNAEVVK